MTLAELLGDREMPVAAARLPVAGIAHDSRKVRPGVVFFALPGAHSDGARFARAACDAGATAVVSERTIEDLPPGTPAVQVPDARRSLAQAAAHWNREPSLELEVVAVTGTNGKTTTTYLLESMFRAAGRPVGVIGTTGVRVAGESRPGALTTPEAPELQALLREMADRGVRSVAFEMSSHALVQRRGFGVHRDVAIFTNLTHDHLDFHGTLEAYLDAKLMLFDGRNGDTRKPWTAVVNADDPQGSRVIDAAQRGGGRISTFGSNPAADFRITEVLPVREGIRMALAAQGRPFGLEIPLLGRHNAWNAAASFAAGCALQIEPTEILAGLASIPAVPGRLERVPSGQPFDVVVDYAHTPDALERALLAAREHASGRVLLVFGCGGERDRAKRPLMGRVAAAASDVAWVTNDNPRHEDPEAIAAAILSGAAPGTLRMELDRREAIARAIEEAGPGDLVLIAGKGHESTQTLGSQVMPFDDRVVAGELLGTERR